MLTKKVACNATNSGAIDNDGQLWVWGSTKYGLCGTIDPNENKKALNPKVDEDGNAKGFAIPQPIKLSMNVDQGFKGLDKKYTFIKGKQFSAFNLLDPPISNNEQVYVASHISYGQYHAGVVVNDISTNYEQEQLPQIQIFLLEKFAAFLIDMYSELEKQEGNPEIQAIEEQIRFKQDLKKDYQQRLHSGTAGRAAADLMMKSHKGGANVFTGLLGEGSKKKIIVPTKIKIEYMLRFYCQKFLNSTFPYVPENYIRNLMQNQAKINLSDKRTVSKLFSFLTLKSEMSMSHDNLLGKKKILREHDKKAHWVNLKEIRDQIINEQCSNGKLFMFGVSNEGRLGIMTPDIPDSRIMHTMTIQEVIIPKTEIVKVECGSAMTLALTEIGLMYSWGFGKSGSLGLGEKSNTQTPEQIIFLANNEPCQDMVDISCGSQHSLAIDRAGRIYSWGNGQGGRLGHDQETGENAPRQIMLLADKQVNVIEAGDASSACRMFDFSVYLWGSGMNGRLGNGTTENVLRPFRSKELDGKQIIGITKGTNNTFAILDTYQVYGFGSSKGGKLGFLLAKGKNYDLPRQIISLSQYEIYQIAAGPFHTILLTLDGQLLSMGNSKDGKLGYELVIGNLVDVEEPQMIRIQKGLKFYTNSVKKAVAKVYPLFEEYDELGKLKAVYSKDDPYEINLIACGYNFQILLSNNGLIFSTGSNKTGQLGIGAEEGDDQVDEEEEQQIIELGKNDNLFIPGQLQDKIKDLSERTEKLIPNKIEIKGMTTKVNFVAVGAAHAVVIMKGNNAVYAWGKNKFGECGQSKSKKEIFIPTKIKAFGSDSVIIMAACGENHTIFLMGNNSVQTCGSNEFGQLGLSYDAPKLNDEKDLGGKAQADTPQQIEKTVLDQVIFVAAGRYHTFVIVKELQLQEEEEEEEEQPEDDSKKEEHDHDKDDHEPEKVVDANHQIYAWGRGYHGQLGIRELQIAQWVPKRIKIVKDPKLKDEEQPNRYKSITCGEKHTIILAINGKMLYSGDRTQVGFKNPNEGRKNMYENVDQSGVYQKEFVKYFDPHEFSPYQNMKFKYVKSNINSKISIAINQQGKTFQFGYKTQFQECMANDHDHWGQEFILDCDFVDKNVDIDPDGDQADIKFVAGDVGREYKSLIGQNRQPYSWGDVRYGKCGIDYNQKAIKKDKFMYDRKNKKMLRPFKIPFFSEKRDKIKEAAANNYSLQQYFKMIDNKFSKKKEEIKLEKTKIEEIKDLKFPIQKVLKAKNQDEYEQLLIQQDVDLIITFKALIEGIHDGQKQEDRKMRSLIMSTQDCIISRVLTFPKEIPIIDDIETDLPKVIILNKQMYEGLWTYLQTHPCYLINWIIGAIKEEIDLFDDHPQSFLDDQFFDLDTNKDLKKLVEERENYLNYSEQHIEMDEYCFLITAVFGGMKQMRNDRRIINMLMIIAQKIFDFEIDSSITTPPKINYTYDQILDNTVECAFIKLHRQIFQLQFQNLQFVEELFEQIVRKLFSNRKKMVDGMEKATAQKDSFDRTQDVFDYETVISNPDLVEIRGRNLIKFLTIIMEEIFMLNFDKTLIDEQKTKTKHFFSNEIMMLTLKAYYKLKDRSKINIKKLFPNLRYGQDTEEAEVKEKEYEDQICKFIFRLIFEDLILRLCNCQTHDIIRIYGQKVYGENPILNIIKKRNNFYFIGVALRQILLGSRIYFSETELDPLRNFTSCLQPNKQYRFLMMEKLKFHIPIKQINTFEQIMIKQTIEQAIEIQNENLTIPLRNIVYVHNQLVRYGDSIFCKGFSANPNVLDKINDDIEPEDDEPVDGSMNMKDGDMPSDSEAEFDDDDNKEMDPVKMVMTALGMQFIILKVYRATFISQVTLNSTINFQISCRIFENFGEIVRCNDCNALVWEGMIPKKRFKEGIKMKQWQCTRPKCGYYNQVEMSLSCGGCGGARPKSTFPQDLMFPLYVPIDTTLDINKFTVTFQTILQTVDLIPQEENFFLFITKIKKREQEKLKKGEDCDFTIIQMISDYEKVRFDYIEIKKKEQNIQETGDPQFMAKIEDNIEDKFTELLCERIQGDMDRKIDHEEIQTQNDNMVKELQERMKYIKKKTEDIYTMMRNIQKYSKYGIGNIELLNFNPKLEKGDPKVKLFAGKLVSMQKHISSDEEEDLVIEGYEAKDQKKKGFSLFGGGDKKKKKKPKKKEEEDEDKEEKKKDNLESYFASMDQKQNLQMTQARLQRKLDENRSIRNLMKAQFGQFKSYTAEELIARDIITSIKLGDVKLAPEVQIHCKYLFYELKNEEEGGDGGYKVELSHEEKVDGGLCGIQLIVEKAQEEVQKKLGGGNEDQGFKNDKNQSILSSFEISNETIMEMRRIMTTKCTVCLEGTTFNIFKLTQLFNTMKTNNKQILEINTKEQLEVEKENNDDEDDDEDGEEEQG